MSGANAAADQPAVLRPDGRLLIPHQAMIDHVMETPGCELWYNQGDSALGLRLLRGVDRPKYVIERVTDQSGRIAGAVEVSAFLQNTGYGLVDHPVDLPWKYFPQFHVLAVMLEGLPREHPPSPTGVLADLPPLPD